MANSAIGSWLVLLRKNTSFTCPGLLAGRCRHGMFTHSGTLFYKPEGEDLKVTMAHVKPSCKVSNQPGKLCRGHCPDDFGHHNVKIRYELYLALQDHADNQANLEIGHHDDGLVRQSHKLQHGDVEQDMVERAAKRFVTMAVNHG